MRLTNALLMMQNAIFENSESFVFDSVHWPKSQENEVSVPQRLQ